MNVIFSLLSPMLHRMDAEQAHALTIAGLKSGLYPRVSRPAHPSLEQTVLGLTFKTPIGMAAGFDKNAGVLQGLFGLGFGFVEAGTVTPLPQEGNPRPRIFRDPKTKSVINRMGFPGSGMEDFLKNYREFRKNKHNQPRIVGINIGKNKDTQNAADDYCTLIRTFSAHADYLTVNISSPNTPGLRDLQKRENLLPLLRDMLAARAQCSKQPPLLVKLAPDIHEDDIEDIANTLLESGIDGLILTNTTLERPATLPPSFAAQAGGLSGPLLHKKSTELIARFYQITQGKLPIIGVGGISSAKDAYEKIRAGASLVQLYTALAYQGPDLISKINRELPLLLKADGFPTLSDAVGANHK